MKSLAKHKIWLEGHSRWTAGKVAEFKLRSENVFFIRNSRISKTLDETERDIKIVQRKLALIEKKYGEDDIPENIRNELDDIVKNIKEKKIPYLKVLLKKEGL
jgi:hypothetical protein